tara:strand:- start:1375 stop:1713 length:339 start_codon:yes stop_codon:yes gene_type:complete
MPEGPLVDEFMRHLQASLDEAMEIEDKIERHDRILQLEIAIQEAIIFKNRYQELVSHGIDPLVLVSQRDGQEAPPPATKSQALTLGTTSCSVCGSTLDPDLDFCPACGAIQK